MNTRFLNYFHKYVRPISAIFNADVNALQTRIDLIATMIRNSTVDAAGLARGSGDSHKIKIANTVHYTVDNVIYAKTTAETVFGADAASVLADGKYCKYLLTLPAGGTPHVIQGNAAASAALALLPAVPASESPIGYLQVHTVGASFTPDTTDLAAGTVTDTYVDFAWVNSGTSSISTALGTQTQVPVNEFSIMPKYS